MIRFPREGQRQFVKSLNSKGAVNIWQEKGSTMDIMVEGSRTRQVASLLSEREIPYSIALPDINLGPEKSPIHFYYCLSKTVKKKPGSKTGMDWKSYHNLETIYTFLDNLATEFPYLCAVINIGHSSEGRDMKLLKISNSNSDNVGVWLDATIHAREWISTAVVTYIANKIVRNFHQLPESITNKDWYILPVLNPDGYVYTHTQDRLWRKSRVQYGQCVGVDLNRNFSVGWGEKGEEASSGDPCNIFYRGPKAFSEPETQAVKRAIKHAGNIFKVFLSFHCYGEVIIFPWGHTREPCTDYVELLEGGAAMAKAIHEQNGSIYKVGSTSDLMYYAAGSSIDWSYGKAVIPYSYMVELSGKGHKFQLPKELILSTADEVMHGVFRLMDYVDHRNNLTSSHISYIS